MSKTVTKKKSKQKEIDPKFGVSEWDPAELDVRHTRHGTYESIPPPRGGTWRDQIKEVGPCSTRTTFEKIYYYFLGLFFDFFIITLSMCLLLYS